MQKDQNTTQPQFLSQLIDEYLLNEILTKLPKDLAQQFIWHVEKQEFEQAFDLCEANLPNLEESVEDHLDVFFEKINKG